MHIRKNFTLLAGGAAVVALSVAALLTQGFWRDWFNAEQPAPAEGPANGHHHSTQARVRLSPQAQANLRLAVKPVAPQSYWRTITVPATVVERHGQGDRGVTAPVAGVVQWIAAVPGDTVRPGDELFTLRLTSEYLQTGQTELYKTAQELKILAAERKRLGDLYKTGTVPQLQIFELDYRQTRLTTARTAHRADLGLRGLNAEQIDRAEEGQFVKEVTIRAPARTAATESAADVPLLEVEEVKVRLGEQVQAGQALLYLAGHQALYIEGRGFKEDASLVERSAIQGWPVSAAFAEEAGDWPELSQELTIRFVASTLDPTSQTFPFYVPLTNQHREYRREGKTYRIWRFRPGQRVRLGLGLRVQQFEGVFVLPAGAVVREGPDAYVFRQNGDFFERRAVHVLHEDSTSAVLGPDSAINPGNHVVHNAAVALNRTLKAQAEGTDAHGHGHDHHGHSH